MAKRHTTTSNTYRFFIDPAAIRGDAVQIEDSELAHQLVSVLRLGSGDQILLLDNTGWEYTAQIKHIARNRISGSIERREQGGGEPRAALTLYAGLMRAERFEWLLQKGTELGVAAFVPLICERSATTELSARKAERWERIVREAAEQSRRSRLPPISSPLRYSEACAQAAHTGLTLLLWEAGGVPGLRQRLRSSPMPEQPALALLSGPEGGLTQGEYQEALRHGIMPVTLGPRTLRAETAPLIAAAAALYELGELE